MKRLISLLLTLLVLFALTAAAAAETAYPVTLTDHAVRVVYLYGRDRHQSESFYCADEIDFAFLRSLHVARGEG